MSITHANDALFVAINTNSKHLFFSLTFKAQFFIYQYTISNTSTLVSETQVAASNAVSAQITSLVYCSSFLYAVGYYTTPPIVNGVSPPNFGTARKSAFLLSVNPTPTDTNLNYRAATFLVGWNDNTKDVNAKFLGCASIAQQIIVFGDYGSSTNNDAFLVSFDDSTGNQTSLSRIKDASAIGLAVSSDSAFLLGSYVHRLWNFGVTTNSSNFVARISIAQLPSIP